MPDDYRLEVRLASETADLLDQLAAEKRTTRAALARALIESEIDVWLQRRALRRIAQRDSEGKASGDDNARAEVP
jgi:predicted DNA-binding protein